MEFQLSAQDQEVAVNVPAEPVATVGTTTGGVELEVYTLDRTGSVVNVVVAVHNTTDAEVKALTAIEAMDEAPEPVANKWDASNVSIVDPKGLKEYRSFLEAGEDAACLCSVTWLPNTKDFAPDERRFYVTQVAAPPAEVTQVNVLTGIASVPNVSLQG